LIETDVAPVTFHSSIEDWPGVMLLGFEIKLTTTGCPAVVVSVTVVEATTEPELFVAVIV